MTEPCPETRGGGERATADARTRQQIAEDHHALGQLLARIEITRDPNLLLRELQELERLLTAHFEREEEDEGLHAMVGESAPHLLTAVQHLFEEHREMSVHLDLLLRETRGLLNGPLAHLLTSTADLIARLRHHEQAEDELVVGALYADLGSSA